MILTILLTIFITFVIVSFFGYWIHKFFHNPISGRFYLAHQTHHFKLYPPTDYLSDKYRSPGKDNTVISFLLLGIPLIALPIILFGFHIISLSILITAMLSIVIFGGLNDYLHDAFHIRNHWLRKFKWFETLTDLHFQHHINVQSNLGIYSFLWDRIFGTFIKNNASI